MRLPFRYEISRRSAADPSPSPPAGELGISGTKVWGGIVDEEYNSALSGSLMLEVYEQMMRDPQVRALQSIISLPIRAATPSVEPAGEGSADKEAAELIETNLLAGMTMTYDDLLRHALFAIFWGFSVLEKVFEERDGHIMWRKFPGRHPRTVERWMFDDEGGVAGIRQQGTDANGEVREVKIPIDRLLLFTWDEMFDNPQGLGLFRSAYKPWFSAGWVHKVVMIGIERFWLNLPKATEPPGSTDDQRQKVLNILKGLRANEYAGIIQPHGWTIEMLEGMQRGGSDISIKLLEYCDHQILMSGLAQFLMLGVTATGARAVSEDQSALFYLSEDAAAGWICETVNRYAIPQLCGFNFPGMTEFPQLVIPPIATVVGKRGIIDAISNALNAAALSADEDVENAIRNMLNLPEIEERPEPSDAPPPSEQPEDDDDDEAPGQQSSASRRTGVSPSRRTGVSPVSGAQRPPPSIARDLTPREQRLNLSRLRAIQASTEEALAGDLSALIERQLALVSSKLKGAVSAAVAGGKQARARLLKTLANLELPFANQYHALLRQHLREIAAEGARVSAESVDVDASDVLRDLQPDLNALADNLAAKHGTDLLFAIREQVPRDVDAGLTAETVLRNVRQAIRDRASINLATSLHAAADRIAIQITGLSEA